MLRLVVLLLVLANAGYFAWSQGLLGAWGFAPAPTGEPQRLQQQIKPGALRLLREDEARRTDQQAAVLAKADCLVAGPLDEAQAAGVQATLASWPAGSWVLEPTAGADARARLLKFPAVDDRLRPRLDELPSALRALKLRPCRAPERTAP